ncbi:MAG: DUF401 family protein [Bacillota bacterium]
MIVIKLFIIMSIIIWISSKTSNIGFALLFGGSLLILIENRSVFKIFSIFSNTLKDKITIELLLTILFITILGSLMDKLGFMDSMIKYLEKILRSTKLTILLTPAIVGTLLVNGGALMSCPMIDKLGDKVNLAKDKKATINLIFRHGLYFIYPLSPSMILAIKIGGFKASNLIILMAPISFAMYIFGYIFFLRDLKVPKLPKIQIKEYIKVFFKFIFYVSPILISIINVFIFDLAFYISLIIGIISLILLYSIKNKKFILNKHKKIIKNAIDLNILIAIFGILFFKNAVNSLSELELFLNNIINTGFPIEIIMFFSAAIISYALASVQPGIAILYPLILPLASNNETKLLLGMFIYVSSFLFYYTSPLHMCQVLTLEYFNVSIKKLYFNYKYILPSVYIVMLVIYFIN